MIDVGPLHLLRPAWLLALPVLPLLWWWLRRASGDDAAWRRAIDPHLLPFLLAPGTTTRRRLLAWLATLAYIVAVFALCGPAWREVEQPTWQTRLPLVVAVDLSSASLASDLPPTRTAQLQARLRQLLATHRDGPIALVAFADDAFTVAPITDDAANVALFVDALQPDVMPVDGQSSARAIAWSRRLIERAGLPRGRIVVVTDHADTAAQRAAADARGAGITVSALGLGTPGGANVRTRSGAIARVALDADSLRALARSGGGDYARLSLDGADRAVFAGGVGPGAAQGRDGGRMLADDGVRLVPVVLLLALIVLVRRPRAAAFLIVVVLMPRQSFAGDLWQRDDQRAHRAIERGIDRYRRGDFDGAAQQFANADSADAHYDRGNALARAGKLEDAIAAYDEALRRQPGMADATANREAVRRAMKQRKPSGGQQSGRNGGASKQSQQSRQCAPGDANCDTQRQAQRTPQKNGSSTPSQASPPKPADAARQAQADAAQRERMQRALQQARARSAAAKPTPAEARRREQRLSDEAALKRVPDEPGSLLREKFRLEQERRQLGGGP